LVGEINIIEDYETNDSANNILEYRTKYTFTFVERVITNTSVFLVQAYRANCLEN